MSATVSDFRMGGGKLPVARDEKRSLSVPTALLGHAAYQRTCSTVQTPPLDGPQARVVVT